MGLSVEESVGNEDHIWDIRNPDGGASGLEFARGRMRAHTDVLAHSLPTTINVIVCSAEGLLVAQATDLHDETPTPMARLRIVGEHIERTNVWPDESDVGKPVILPGGEVGILRSWSNAADGSEWTWTVELHNHR